MENERPLDIGSSIKFRDGVGIVIHSDEIISEHGDDQQVTIDFVCNSCAEKKHEECKKSTWCDCQHRSR